MIDTISFARAKVTTEAFVIQNAIVVAAELMNVEISALGITGIGCTGEDDGKVLFIPMARVLLVERID